MTTAVSPGNGGFTPQIAHPLAHSDKLTKVVGDWYFINNVLKGIDSLGFYEPQNPWDPQKNGWPWLTMMSYMTQIKMPKSPQHECTWIYIYIHRNIILNYDILYYTILYKYYIILYYIILHYIFLFILYTYTHIRSYTHIHNIFIYVHTNTYTMYIQQSLSDGLPACWLSRLGVPEFLHQWRSWIVVDPCRRMTSHYIYGYGSIPIDTFLRDEHP